MPTLEYRAKIKDEFDLQRLKDYGFKEYTSKYVLKNDETKYFYRLPHILATVHKEDRRLYVNTASWDGLDELIDAEVIEFLPIEISEEERRLSR